MKFKPVILNGPKVTESMTRGPQRVQLEDLQRHFQSSCVDKELQNLLSIKKKHVTFEWTRASSLRFTIDSEHDTFLNWLNYWCKVY